MRIITGQFTVGLDTYNYEVTAPDEMVFTLSRHVYVRVRLTDTNDAPVAGLQIQLVTRAGVQMNTGEFRYTDADGSVTFDIARLLQIMSAGNGADKELASIEYRAGFFSPWLSTDVTIALYMTGTMFQSIPVRCYNGAHETWKDWWSKPRRLKWWTEYPFTFDFINSDKINYQADNGTWKAVLMPETAKAELVRINPEEFNVTFNRRLTFHERFYAAFNNDHNDDYEKESIIGLAIVEGDQQEHDNYVTLEADKCADHTNRTYLRWLGSHGEVFYWLFFDGEESVQVSSERYSRPLTDDRFTGYATNRRLDNGIIRMTEKKTTKKICTEWIDGEIYGYVLQLASAEHVDMYLGNDRWKAVTIEDATVTRNLRDRNSRIALTIDMGG